MDAPVKTLGRNHRNERHDLRTVSLLYATKGAKAAEHALGHIILDKSISPAKTTVGNLVNSGMKNVLNQIKEIKGVDYVGKYLK